MNTIDEQFTILDLKHEREKLEDGLYMRDEVLDERFHPFGGPSENVSLHGCNFVLCLDHTVMMRKKEGKYVEIVDRAKGYDVEWIIYLKSYREKRIKEIDEELDILRQQGVS